MKTVELEGAALDYWVARAELNTTLDGMVIKPYAKNQWTINCQDDDSIGGYICGGTIEGIKLRRALNLRLGEWHYRPSCDWSCGGPIIERERITAEPHYPSGWFATNGGADSFKGPTLLIAAMRCYVTSKFGDEVEDIPSC